MGRLCGVNGMATTIAILAFVEVLSVGAGIAIGQVLWADRVVRAATPAPIAISEATGAMPTAEGSAKTEALPTSIEQLPPESLADLMMSQAKRHPPALMLDLKASLEADVSKAYLTINEKYCLEMTRVCKELLEQTDSTREGGNVDPFELEQFKSQVETSMNNLTLLHKESSAHDLFKNLQSEIAKICVQIERIKV